LQISDLVGAVFQDIRERQRLVFMDAGSRMFPASERSPTLALATKLILEAPELRLGQFGRLPDDLLYHPPPFLIVYADTMFIHAGRGWVVATWPL
jgi:hypothetical protein